jgi:hypothetical protein
MKSRLLSIVMIASFVAAAQLCALPSAFAKNAVPFKGNVTATWDHILSALPPPTGSSLATFTGGGPMTHMGNTTQTGTLTLQPPNAAGAFPGSGSLTITAANGDTVTFDYVGVLTTPSPTTGVGSGTFIISGGTGRFADAKGSGEFRAVIDMSQPALQPMTVVLDGRIAY